MIGNFEIEKKTVGYPVKNITSINGIRTIILSYQDFYFSSEANFEDHDQWIAAIKAESIFVFNNIKEVDNQSEQTEYNKSELDYEYETRKGKYKYILRTLYNKQYHDHIQSFSGQDLRVFIVDINRNVHAYLSGSQVKGLDVDLFTIEEKKIFGTPDPAWTIVRLILSDPQELNLVTKMTWNPNRFDLIHVVLSDLSGDGNYIDFTIKDSNFDIEIDHLYINDIVLTDNTAITRDSLIELSCGRYRLIASGPITFGTIQINSDNFYSSETSYVVSQNTVVLNNFVYDSFTQFTVDVRYAGDLSLYTGLELTDFTMTDDTNGPVSINSVTEVSTGRYQIITNTNLTSGDIDIDDGIVTGTGEYLIIMQLTIDNFTYDDIATTESLNFDVSLDAVPFTTVLEEDITIIDNISGELTITAFTNNGDGSYELTVAPVRTSGTITISKTNYYGSAQYDLETATFENCGASDTTDWTDTNADGVADRLQPNEVYYDYEIVSGSTGFPGSAQKIERISALQPYAPGARIAASYFKPNTAYKLRFKYHTSNAGTGSDRYTFIYLLEAGTGYANQLLSVQLEPDTLYYDIYESGSFTIDSRASVVFFDLSFQRNGMSILIDELELIEV